MDLKKCKGKVAKKLQGVPENAKVKTLKNFKHAGLCESL